MAKKAAVSETKGVAPVRLNVLGEVSLKAGDKLLTDNNNRSLKMWGVLCYLIINRGSVVTQAKLIDMFWPEEHRSSPASSLKMLILRLRSLLEPLFGEGVDPIVSHRGGYQWNPDIPCETDAERFEALCLEAERTEYPACQRIELYYEAIGLYKGDLCPKHGGQYWVITLGARYHDKYVMSVKSCALLMEQAGQYQRMMDISTRACELIPLDEQLHILLLRSLLLQNEAALALRHYQKATKLFYDCLGVGPSDEMKQLYTKIMSVEKSHKHDLENIIADMKEPDASQSAFVCEPGFFETMYRVEARRASRTGGCLHVALITLSAGEGVQPPLKAFAQVMDNLQHVIINNLRRSDVVSRYSSHQFIIMLPYANLEDSGLVMDRIVSAFHRQFRGSAFKLSYSLHGLEVAQ